MTYVVVVGFVLVETVGKLRGLCAIYNKDLTEPEEKQSGNTIDEAWYINREAAD